MSNINDIQLRIVHISDTHNRHHLLSNLPDADVIVHSGDFTEQGTEGEVLDFLNWFIELPYKYKMFVCGNHDLCLWDAEGIEDLPEDVHFLQDKGCEIEGIRFFGIAYNHTETFIPYDVDVLVTHEPPIMILDKSSDTYWGNAPLRNRIFETQPNYHLFGHVHDAFGTEMINGMFFSNGSMLNEKYEVRKKARIISITRLLFACSSTK